MKTTSHGTLGDHIWDILFKVMCALIFAFLVLPIFIAIPLSFNSEPFFSFTKKMLTLDPSGYSTRWYELLLTYGASTQAEPYSAQWWSDIWQTSRWIGAFKNSIIVGSLAAILATALGTLAALGLSNPALPGRRLLTALLISPMMVPVIISATALFFFYSKIGLMTWNIPYLGLVMSHALLGAPFVVITVTATLEGFDRTYVRAAASLGAGPIHAFRKVTLPLILPGVISGALFAFGTSFDEVVMALFLASPSEQTIPKEMWGGIREQISPAILAVATILVVLSIALLTVVEALRRRSSRLRGLAD